MATTRIKDLTESQSLNSSDYFVIDNNSGTKKVKAENLIDDTLSESGKFADAKAVGDELDAVGDSIPTVDNTLSIAGAAADAKKTGDEITGLKEDLEQIFSDDAKQALLACFRNTVWAVSSGGEQYTALENALYAETFPGIKAYFNSGAAIIYTDDALDTLKQYMTVKFYQASGDSGIVVPSSDYTLSGTLTAGKSTITVTYGTYTTYITIDTVDFYNQQSIITTLASVGNIYKNGSLNVLMSDTTTLARAVIGLSKGRQSIYKKNPYEALFYPIPIPSGAVRVTVECASTLLPNIASWQWNGSNYGAQILNTGWLPAGGGSATFEAIENGFVTVVFKKSDSSDFTDADLPVNVSITFE